MSRPYNLLISIVSHGQMELVNDLLFDLALCDLERCKIVVRSNVNESVKINMQGLDCTHVKNLYPAGFSYNHNRNFEIKKSQYFAILNPDLKIIDKKIFKKLINVIDNNPESLVCPSVVNETGNLEDSARSFPTFLNMTNRLLFNSDKKFKREQNKAEMKVDWCAGMFHLYTSKIYIRMKGLSEKYFLYCEDVDISLRMQRAGFSTLICNDIFVRHDARRDSHKKIKYFIYHIRSYIRLYLNIYLRIH
jgi:N-acetylglucosaminyl-diphospho-decaprenol L-rhamnosyltransferase